MLEIGATSLPLHARWRLNSVKSYFFFIIISSTILFVYEAPLLSGRFKCLSSSHFQVVVSILLLSYHKPYSNSVVTLKMDAIFLHLEP